MAKDRSKKRNTPSRKGKIRLTREVRNLRRGLAEREKLTERLATVIEATNDGVWDWDFHSGDVYFSTRWYTMLGYHPEELPPSYDTWVSLLHPDDKERAIGVVWEHIEKGLDRFEMEFRMRCRDGSWRWIEARGMIVTRDVQGSPIRMAGTHTDIHLRKQAEEAIRTSEERFRMVADFTYDWEDWRSPLGHFIYVSPSCERITGRNREEYLGDSRIMESIVHPEDLEAYRKHRREEDENQTDPLSLDFRVISIDGHERWVGHICQPVHDRNGVYRGRRSSNRDVTEEKKAEKLKEDVERITRHDLKSPLSGIVNIPKMLRRDSNITERQSALLRALEDSGYQMLSLINRSLDLYKMEKSIYELVPASFDLLNTLAGVIRELRPVAGSREASVKVTVEGRAPEKEKPFIFNGEELLCHSMLSNLIKNGLEATTPGGAMVVDVCRDKGQVLIRLRNPLPIPEEIRDHFFGKYKTHGKRYGTGLGAYSARLVALTHGGDIQFTTSTDQGTEITVRLPDRKGTGNDEGGLPGDGD